MDKGNLFPTIVGNFTRIKLQKIDNLKIDSNEDYENLLDVVIYCNNDCTISCGIIIEQYNNKPQFTVTQFDALVSIKNSNLITNIKQLKNNNWGYEGFSDIDIVNINNINKAKNILLNYMKIKSF
ncbi:hypothetical protein EJM68_02935 [Clostridium botulinum]|uniref:hypothetical protein n=1 Tax=Clostridium botulinum TaxID=1491 RepID=UPI001375A886|nr:hypothetical protein [Clostridium botulinum]NCI71701.1 hypothetical protein [Clostridium botulinum]